MVGFKNDKLKGWVGMFKYKWYGLVTKPLGAAKVVLSELTIEDLHWDTFMRRFINQLKPFRDDGLVAGVQRTDKGIMKLKAGYPHRIAWVIGWYSVLGIWLILAFFINVIVEMYIGGRDYVRGLSRTYRSSGLRGWAKRFIDFVLRYGKSFAYGARMGLGKLAQLYEDGEFSAFFKKVVLKFVFVFSSIMATAIFLQVCFGINILKPSYWFDYETTAGKQPAEAIFESIKLGDATFGINGLRIHDDSFGFYDYASEASNNEWDVGKSERNVEEAGSPFVYSSILFLVLLVAGGEFFDSKFMRREVSTWGKEKEIDERLQDEEGSDAESAEQAVNKEEGHTVYESDRFMDLKIANGKRQFSKKQVAAISREHSYTRTQTKGDRGRDFRSVDDLMSSYKNAQDIYRRTKSTKKGPKARFSAPYDPNRKLRTSK